MSKTCCSEKFISPNKTRRMLCESENYFKSPNCIILISIFFLTFFIVGLAFHWVTLGDFNMDSVWQRGLMLSILVFGIGCLFD